MEYRILHICPSFNNLLYSEIIERQIMLNKWVRVFYFRGKKEGLPNSDKSYVDGVTPFGNVDRFFFKMKEKKLLKAFKGIYNSKQIDLLHAHTLFVSGYLAYIIKREWKVPYVVAVRGSDINVFFKYRINLRNIGVKIMENASKVFFLSNKHMEKVFNEYIPQKKRTVIRKKSIILGNGINDFWLDNAVAKKAEPNKGILNIIYYGDVNKNKNIKLTVSALEKLSMEGYKITYTIIGKILENEIFDYIKQKAFIRYITFKSKEELIGYLHENDIFIMPSFSETFGLSYIEAMSQGLPVIYTKGQGIDGMFQEGTVGYHVDPTSLEDMVKAIKKILLNYNTISSRCIDLAKEFRWDVIVDRYQKIYDDILQKRSL